MKIAIVHDDLIQFGGAEKVFIALLDLFPEAYVFSSVISPEWKRVLTKKNIVYKASFMQNLPNAVSWNKLYGGLLFHCLAFERFNFNAFDLVISSSSRFAHGVITRPETKHVCYMHSPGRMFWEDHAYFSADKIKKTFGSMLSYSLRSLPLSYMRLWDYASAQRVDHFIANSIAVHNKIVKFYQKDSTIIYPFCDVSYFSNEPPKDDNKFVSEDFFLILSRLVSWKRVDLVIEACEKAKVKLYIAGDGPDRKRLEKLARGRAVFLGFVDEDTKKSLLKRAKALVFPQEEDFGIAVLEAMASGTPVIAYRGGGALETVVSGVTGEFFDSQTADSLASVLAGFDKSKYSPQSCVSRASQFDKNVFQDKIRSFIDNLYVSNAQKTS